jgi:hypothetical protein
MQAAPITPGDSHSIAGLRWASHPGCERVVIDLVRADGSAAERTGLVSAELLRAAGVVRVRLDNSVIETGATTAEMSESLAPKSIDLKGELAGRAFIVRSDRADGGSLFVDIHLSRPAEARLLTLPAPARVVIDLRPGGGDAAKALTQLSGGNDPSGVVVLSPPGPTASYPLRITGYARTFEANVVAEVRQAGSQTARANVTASDWIEAWGFFTLTIERGPTGQVEVFVGDYSPRDGAEEGVHYQLALR